jgi:uncharacterized protein (DUF1810 family)
MQPAEHDPYNLQRFTDAQAPIFADALAELRAGRKRGHWMWFVFPQIRGLGHSATAQFYAIGSLAEAQAYLRHPELGSRLVECCRALNALEGRDAAEIFGYPDDLKLRSSLTLFAHAAPHEPLLAAVLRKYFPAGPDPLTLARL